MDKVKFALYRFLFGTCWLLWSLILETICIVALTILSTKCSCISQSRIPIKFDSAPTSRTLCSCHHSSHDRQTISVIMYSLSHLSGSSDKIIGIHLINYFVILICVISWSCACVYSANDVWTRPRWWFRLLILKIHLNMRYLRWRSIASDIRLASHCKFQFLNFKLN